jgi:hypothetical protein
VEKKRKCRTEAVVNYREPTNMTFRAMDEDGGSDDDGSGSDDDAMGGGSKRARGSDACEWMEATLNKVLQAMVAQGYGNWAAIRRASKLRWSSVELAKACRHALLQLLFWASLGDKAHEASWGTTTASSSTGEGSSGGCVMDACPDDVDLEKWALEDLSYVAAHLGKHRACRLALAALEACPPAVLAVGAGVTTVAGARSSSGVPGWDSEADAFAAAGVTVYNEDAAGSGTLVPLAVVRAEAAQAALLASDALL